MATKKMDLLFETINEAKNSLFEIWENNGNHFPYSFEKKQEGLLSDLIGTTAILLMLVAFRREPEVISKTDKVKVANFINSVFPELLETVEESGFVATPLVDIQNSSRFFNKSVGYTDTVSWALSSALLARFAEFHNIITISSEAHNAIFTLILKSIRQILDGQNKEGCWGFTNDEDAKKSLYFTYAAGIALGDFFDYAVGEIKDVEEANSASKNSSVNFKDYELLNYISKNYYADEDRDDQFDIVIAAEQARENLSKWLLKNCLPALVELSGCKRFATATKEKLGLFSHETDDEDFVDEGINYYNLYYTYYVIDLMVVSRTDETYQTIFEHRGQDQYSQIFKNIKSTFENQYSHFADYFFGSDNIEQNGITLWQELVSQAIHSSRYHYLNASRTGKKFWDSKASELPLQWVHADKSVKKALNSLSEGITDPALIPMSLRVNAMYGYYICNQADVTVDTLFDVICNDVSKKSDDIHTKGLWDKQGFDLMITERSIEALVDYYDYLCKVGDNGGSGKSKFEESVDKKIYEYLLSEDAQSIIHSDERESVSVKEYLASEEGKIAIRQAVAGDEASIKNYLQSDDGKKLLQETVKDLIGDLPSGTGSAADPDDIVSAVNTLHKTLNRADILDDNNDLSLSLVQLYKDLEQFSLCNLLVKLTEREDNETDKTYKDRIRDTAEKITEGYHNLLKEHAGDAGTNQGDLVRLYKRLKSASFLEAKSSQ